MWRYSLPVLLFFCSEAVHGQTSHRHPIYEEPPEEERRLQLAKKNSTIDELLFPLSYYQDQDNIFFGMDDSIVAANKLKRTYFFPEDADADAMPALHYTYYDKMGRLEQESTRFLNSDDSLVHKWKYDAAGNIKAYITMNFTITTGTKRKVNGDSVTIKYSPAGQPIEITRYTVNGAGAGRTASLISKDTYTYNAANQILTKGIDGYKYTYKYDKQNRISRIECKANYDGEKYTIDSFAWGSNATDDTMFHWALTGYDKIRVLMEWRITNRITGNELEYVLFPGEKWNFIREVNGETRLVYSYDAAGHLIRRQLTGLDGTLYSEMVFNYGNDGLLHSLTVMYLRDPEEDLAPLPPQAKGYSGEVFIARTLNYLVPPGGKIPETIEVKSTLIGIKGETREILANSMNTPRIKIMCEYYP